MRLNNKVSREFSRLAWGLLAVKDIKSTITGVKKVINRERGAACS